MLKAMIVEDSPTVLMTIKLMMTSIGFEVSTAESAEDALLLLAPNSDYQPDLIITDLQMPGDDGITLITKIKAHDVFKNTPILILTSDTEKTERQKAKDAGAVGWLVKPIAQARLLDIIKKVLPNFTARK